MANSPDKNSRKSLLFFLAGIAITVLVFVAIQQGTRQPEQPTELQQTKSAAAIDQETANTQTPEAPPLALIATLEPTSTALFVPVDIDTTVDENLDQAGVLAFSMMDGLHHHIFIYHPQFFPLTRLTNNSWDDKAPAFSHDGQKLAYASNQTGNWEIFVLDLTTYEVTNLTSSTSYESNPAWSPDDQWIVFESDRSGNFDLFLQSMVSPTQEPIQLTFSQADEFSPAWSSQGRLIAYTSLESGNEDIWIADLDKVDNRYSNISQQPETLDHHPIWSPSEESVFWGSNQALGQMMIKKAVDSEEETIEIITGSLAAFHPQGEKLAVVYHAVDGSTIGIYDLATEKLVFPFEKMAGRISGITWTNQNIDLLLPLLNQSMTASIAPADWQYVQDSSDSIPKNRIGLVPLSDVETAFPYLHDEVDESFEQLHTATTQTLGWDFLSTLNNAFVPITQPPPPMIEDYWLYSGRAFEIDDAPSAANWLVTIRENIDGKTYWRIYLKPIDQTGAVGDKLHQRAWSFALRTQGNPDAYEQGGAYTQAIPEGYWVDFTEIANQFGWIRVPSLLNWRTYYPGTQHTIFVYQEYLNLETALLELYPPEALLPPATDSFVPVRPTAVPEENDD